MTSFTLQLNGPLDADLSLHFWRRATQEEIDIVEGNTYSRLFIIENRPVLLQINLDGTTDKPRAVIGLEGERTESLLGWAMETARWILNDDAPLQKFYAHIAEHAPLIAPLCTALRGLRPLRSPSVFDTMVFAIVGQQVNVSFAYSCKQALEHRYASSATINGRTWTAGLEPTDLAEATIEDLREMKISRSKARTILELAEAFSRLPLERQLLGVLSAEEIEDSLTQLWGIGPWTARYTLMRALGALDVLPIGDSGLRNAVQKIYELEEKPDADSIISIAKAWRPYRGLTTYYLWHRGLVS